MSTFFTSDTHFGHAKVIGYSQRPFADIDEMHAELIRRWNERVQPGDTVYHLGDFALGPRENIGKYRAQLNGRIVLVRGNHDRSKTAMLAAGFDEVHNALELEVDDVRLFLRHIPDYDPRHINRKYDRSLLKEPQSAWLPDFRLCGHVHNAYDWVGDMNRGGVTINVGVDVRDYRPVTLAELLAPAK
jgi:calcineurin-like phosphoesterase family protein